jgi:hypothetical protein
MSIGERIRRFGASLETRQASADFVNGAAASDAQPRQVAPMSEDRELVPVV